MTASKSAVVVPALDIDVNRTLTTRSVLQRCIVANLLAHMSEGGWNASQVLVDGYFIKTPTVKAAMEQIHGLSVSDLTFVDTNENSHFVRLIPSNDLDMIVNWTSEEGDPDGFDALISEFNAEIHA